MLISLEATVSRFARRLGFKGFIAFKLAMANAIAGRSSGGNPLSGEIEWGFRWRRTEEPRPPAPRPEIWESA